MLVHNRVVDRSSKLTLGTKVILPVDEPQRLAECKLLMEPKQTANGQTEG